MNSLADNTIMLKVKAGDLDKMGLLFERYHRPLYGFLFHMTYQRETSEDLVQQVFYKMLKYRETFTATGEFVHWMYSIARNAIKDQGKSLKQRVKHENTDDHTERLSGGLTPEEYLEKKQAKLGLYKAMEKLSDSHREVLTLSKFQELKYQEIAHILDISEIAVKTRAHRAMQELKSIYEKTER
ncbi:RNA polymerase sigma factor [Mucilaginibacter sp.]|uniref:RNA polymerase sigma factor n=1 Tax=Mucilaginibacter sp. TaxID=1882438 RepID=UPI002639666E|nr:RNA polymerase sigma factor [Mucilaginibacter sp.]MDB4920717.1 sigma-70 family polymerase sigma factor [Mucilaginibacter sp.]